MKCSFCGSEKKKMTIFWNENTGEILTLCFHGCQHFVEPFRDSKAGLEGWIRIDPWQHVKRAQPRLRKDAGFRIVNSPIKQVKLDGDKESG